MPNGIDCSDTQTLAYCIATVTIKHWLIVLQQPILIGWD